MVDGLAINVLGELTATAGGQPVDLGGRRQRAVLAMLLIARGTVVTVDRMTELLWGPDAPVSAAATIQSYVSHLRRLLEPGRDARSRSNVIVSTGGGYALRVPEHAVDAWQFERLAQRGDARAAAEALTLWRGPAFVDITGAAWADVEASRLAELREVVRERSLAARLDAGESAVLVAEIEALVAAAPLREERWRLLVIALYRAHRQGDALAALRRARAVLTVELGVEPGPALRALELEVLTQSPTLDLPAVRQPVSARHGTGLVDRDRELAELRGYVDGAVTGRARIVLVEGPAGIGKSRLVAEARRMAAEAGARTLTARGSQLEREFGLGVVRQLFEPTLTDPSVLAGTAGPARVVFEPQAAGRAPADHSFAVLDGLYCLAAGLAGRRPLVLAIDDLHWCDAASVRFLAYLACRLDGLDLLVVTSLRSGEEPVDERYVADLAHDPSTVSIRPAPLSGNGVAELVRNQLGAAAPDAFVAACRRATSGNPLLLTLLLRALDVEGIRPETAPAGAVAEVGSRAVSSLVLSWLARLPAPAPEVAHAVAVLGDGALLPDVAALAGVPEAVAADAVAALSRSGLLRGEYPLGFVHPLVADAAYRRTAPADVGLRHERAARVLTARGAPAEQVASHLLHAPPRGDARVVDVLRRAAEIAAQRGAAEAAGTYYQRALAEPPTPGHRLDILVELGLTQARHDGRAAVRHLGEAFHLLPDGERRADVAIALAQALAFAGGPGEATTFARRARTAIPADLVDQRQALQALERITGSFHGIDPKLWRTRDVAPVAGTGIGARMIAATLASEAMLDGADRAACVSYATFALADGELLRVDPGLFWVVAGFVQEMCDQDVGPLWEDALDDAYARGALFSAMAARLWLGYQQWRRGDLVDAYLSLAIAREQGEAWGSATVAVRYAEAFAVNVLLDRGAVADARAYVRRFGARPHLGDGAMLFAQAEARLLVAEGRPAEALSCLDATRSAETGVDNPAWNGGRRVRARAVAALGRRAEAADLAEEELRLARRWGAPSAIGRALVLLAAIRPDRAPELTREAVAVLAGSPARLEYARALAATGATPALQEAYEIARDCAADGLRAELAAELDRRGAAVRPGTSAALAGIERRIVSMLLEGAGFRDIAQRMLVTPTLVRRTVEALCARMGVRSHEELWTVTAVL